MLIGFTPTEVAKMQDFQRLEKRSREVSKRKEMQFNEDVANDVARGDTASARAKLLKRQQEDPTFDAKTAARQVARTVEEETKPLEVRRVGSRSNQQDTDQLLKLFSPVSMPPSEVQRKQLQHGVMQQLGLAGMDQPDLTEAGLMDQLMSADPSLSRRTAQTRVQKVLGLGTVDPSF
jgi:hypothetical protein